MRNECDDCNYERYLYKTLKMGGINVPIYVDESLEEEGALGSSEFSGEAVEISLHPGIMDNPELLQTTLYHELFHMISSLYSLNLEESDVSTLAIAILEVQKGLTDTTKSKKVKKEKLI